MVEVGWPFGWSGDPSLFFVVGPDARPQGYEVVNETTAWTPWLSRNIPRSLHVDVRRRLSSNLKHLLAGLEFKAALIAGHRDRGPANRPVLFESYFQILILEFCVGAFSVFEGLGAAHWLAQEGRNGADAPRVSRERWLPALCANYDAEGQQDLARSVEATLAVRDLLHQDRLGAREMIDWHALRYEAAFVPASVAMRVLLMREAEFVPGGSNLT